MDASDTHWKSEALGALQLCGGVMDAVDSFLSTSGGPVRQQVGCEEHQLPSFHWDCQAAFEVPRLMGHLDTSPSL